MGRALRRPGRSIPGGSPWAQAVARSNGGSAVSDVILHAFNWRHSWLEERAREIAACGYGAVLVPPPLYTDERGEAWWQRYQPRDYRVVRSWLGRKEELQRGIEALRA